MELIALASLLVLGDAAEKDIALVTLTRRPNVIWAPAECPLCAAGTPLDTP